MNLFKEQDECKIIIKNIVNSIHQAIQEKEKTLAKNVIDPFSAIFDAAITNKSFEDWLSSEKSRQVQKTLQNEIGYFHQKILGTINNWEDAGVGGISDLFSEKHKVIAEIKNKFNTTNSTSRLGSYDTLEALLQKSKYQEYTAYFVEIIPKNKKRYNKPFTPSDSKTKTLRPNNENIRIIDGHSFYKLVTGEEDALNQCYEFILEELVSLTNYNNDLSKFKKLFLDAFG